MSPEMDEKKYGVIDSCEIEIPDPFCLVVFGASGDLARRKILPAVYRLNRDRLLPDKFFILGLARTGMDERGFRDTMKEAVKAAFPQEFDQGSWREFSEKLYFLHADYEDQESYTSLSRRISVLEKSHASGGNRIFYLAVPPHVYEPVISNMGRAGLSAEAGGYAHVVIEKPFGQDLTSAKRLNEVLRGSFRERQIYRMDHYLAKETVQNVLMFRFANAIFEPIWNRRYIDHVQITVAETLGVEHRAGYYEKAGVIRDMFQNHLFQLLALTAMEPPSWFEAERVRDERAKVLRSVRNFEAGDLKKSLVTGQYGGGSIGGREVAGYRDEPGVSPVSMTPTFAALKVYIDNWRWNGVPFYLRSGKRLSRKKAEISIHFKPVPHLMFAKSIEEEIEPNVLIMRIQPDEGISIFFQAKTPGSRVCLSPVDMNFSYEKIFSLSDYERILLDCMQGDQMLFVRDDGVELAWSLLAPVLEETDRVSDAGTFPNYSAGSSGPAEAEALLGQDGRSWREL